MTACFQKKNIIRKNVVTCVRSCDRALAQLHFSCCLVRNKFW